MSWTLESLREHLQAALDVEHATIPPYFTAWISIKDTTNVEAAEIIRSVMLEEMLHLTLAANLLNAVGGRPSLTHQGFVPRYPHRMPFSGDRFEINIERFSKLRKLSVFRTAVSDAGLTSIEKLPSLEVFVVGESKVTEEGKKLIQKTLPRVKFTEQT